MGLNEIEGITRDKISLSSKNSDVPKDLSQVRHHQQGHKLKE